MARSDSLKSALRRAAAAGLVACLGLWPAQAQTYPTKPIRIVVPSAPSTPPDLVARIIAGELQRAEGWTVFVENKAGGVQTIAGRDVAQSPPDGYSIFAPSMVSAAARSLVPNSKIDMERDFAPVIKATVSYNVLVVKPGLEARQMSDLVALIKAKPGGYNYSSGGFGTPAHLIGELFKLNQQLSAVHVPYQQFPMAISDLLSGVNDFMFVTTLPVTELVQSGKLRALAVTSPRPMAGFPGVPTVAEQGFPDLAIQDWVGFVMPAKTPEAIVTSMNAAINRALQNEQVRLAMSRIGAEPVGGASKDFASFIASEVKAWEKTIQDAKITLSK
ncbi:MAG: tripartite tricarboxylate transporter substrate-binding protein [Beijerinckiaceae bacterium]|nr:tripartite tricarboxylate transporter substrate-binding protein [Beijerinckiaceae bacterium]